MLSRVSLPLAVLAIALVSSCAGPVRTLSQAQPERRPLSAEDADRILAGAMVEVFPDAPIERVALPLPIVRYQATLRIAFDTHTITASGTPEAGSYRFTVSDFGTIPLSGGARAAKLYAAIEIRLAAP